MIAPLAKFIDWSALQMAYVVSPVRHVPESKWRLAEALEFLNGPDFFPAASDPARIEFDGRRNFRFPTPRPSEDEENNIVYGRLYRCAERWQERPVIILLDGAPSLGYHTVLPLIARRFNRAGFNAALLVAPYQLRRRPRRPVEENCLKFARAMAQNVAEIRALTGWLLDEGCPSVALLGVSFGGWTAGLTACSDARIACAVLTVPGVRMFSSPPVVWRRVRKALQALRPAQEAMDTTRLNLTLSTPVISKENILLIYGIHDLVAEGATVRGALAKVAAAGNLAIASRSCKCGVGAGLDGTCASLADTEVGSRSKNQRMGAACSSGTSLKSVKRLSSAALLHEPLRRRTRTSRSGKRNTRR